MGHLENEYLMVTGGAGFVGSNFILQWISEVKKNIINLDKLTHAGNLNNLSQLEHHNSYQFIKGDVRNRTLVLELLNKYKPKAIVHFAAETHVDRSIYHPEHFIQTNIVGTFELLESVLPYWKHLPPDEQANFRFLHISTDEVYGSLTPQDVPFNENSLYSPHTPYASSKASSDHIVRTYFQTYGLPVLIARSTKNYGPFQFPDKFVPSTIVNALQGNPLTIPGDGQNMRSWVYVGDLCAALRLILAKGTPGETYNISEETEFAEIDLVKTICQILDELKPDSPHKPHGSLIKFTKDKPGYDKRYALNSSKIRQLGWQPKEPLQANLRKTIQWYLHHMPWVENVVSGEYRDWITTKHPETANT